MYVSGTAPVMPDGGEPPDDAYAQARRCLEIIVGALADAGAGVEDVVRTRVYVTRSDVWEEVAVRTQRCSARPDRRRPPW